MTETKPVSVVKFALGALVGVLILNFILRLVLKLSGVPVTMGVAMGVAGLAAVWFAKSTGRVPTPPERSRFLWLYGGSLALLFLVFMFLASLKATPTMAGFFIFLLHYLLYPVFAHIFFSEKHFAKFLPK